jgi:RNA polymerase sigma-70 factor, ECF subfamily
MLDRQDHDRDEQRWSTWMAAANGGDKIAYKQLLTELAEVLEAYLRHRFGNLQLLEDCVQESLLAIHCARHTYDPARPFRPWMFTIIRHKTIDILRKSRRLARNEGEVAANTMLNQSGHYESDPVDTMIDGARMLDRMEPDHRDAVALTQYAGYSVPEAALRLGISESALKARLRRGLIAMRKQLEAEEIPL